MTNGPHKAVIRIVTDIFPMLPDGELHPVPSSVDWVILAPIYGQNLEECQALAKEVIEKCQNKKKN